MSRKIRLRESSVADAYAIARAEADGFSNDPVFSWFSNYNNTLTPEALTFSSYRTREKIVSSDKLVIVASTETCDVAGVATWYFWPRGRRSFDTPMKRLQRPYYSWQSWLYHKIWTDEAFNAERAISFFTKNFAMHDHLTELKNAKNGYWYLSLLSTVASERRKRVATALLNWGKERARKDNAPIFVEASPDGLALYLNAGFQIIDEAEIVAEGIQVPLKMTHVIWYP